MTDETKAPTDETKEPASETTAAAPETPQPKGIEAPRPPVSAEVENAATVIAIAFATYSLADVVTHLSEAEYLQQHAAMVTASRSCLIEVARSETVVLLTAYKAVVDGEEGTSGREAVIGGGNPNMMISLCDNMAKLHRQLKLMVAKSTLREILAQEEESGTVRVIHKNAAPPAAGQ